MPSTDSMFAEDDLQAQGNLPEDTHPAAATPLADAALAAIGLAARQSSAQPLLLRNVWQPDTWLIQQVWEALAAAGETEAALAVARQAASRDPLAPNQALYQLAKRIRNRPEALPHIGRELTALQKRLFAEPNDAGPTQQSEQLLLAAATAAQIGESALAFSYLERLDQIKRAWDDIFPNPELRSLLAATTACVGLHPLTTTLIRSAIRRFGEAGAEYLQQITAAIAPELEAAAAPPTTLRLLQRCVETVRYAGLTTMHSQRVATAILARAGLADEVMAHLNTVARIQEARRESGLSLRKNDQSLLRQVKRPQADADVDFLVYTLQEAIRAMPVRDITREQRIELSKQLAALGMRSDGWTAAGAATTLINLGALKFASEVVDNIAPTDPTRSEGTIALVDGLLSVSEAALADEEAQKGLAWAKSTEGENAMRATIWGLAEVYLAHGRPEQALALLAARPQEAGFTQRLRTLFQPRWDDDDLRDNRLRLAARLQQNADAADVDSLVRALCDRAPQLLEGEALINFYTEGMLEPLLAAGRTDLAVALLPDAGRALAASGGGKHAIHVARLAELLVAQLQTATLNEAEMQALRTFIVHLWQADAEQGLWQTIHGVEGSLGLLLALEGTHSLQALARAAEIDGHEWGGEQN